MLINQNQLKMRKTKVKFLLFFALLFLATSTSTYAQTGEGSTQDSPEAPPAAPINEAIPLLALMGIAFAYKAFAKSNVKI